MLVSLSLAIYAHILKPKEFAKPTEKLNSKEGSDCLIIKKMHNTI